MGRRARRALLRLFGEGAERERELAVCRRLDERLGPHGRRLIYVRMFEQRELMLRYNDQGCPPGRTGPCVSACRSRSGSSPARWRSEPGIEREDEAVAFAELDWVAELLADGRPYLLRRPLHAPPT